MDPHAKESDRLLNFKRGAGLRMADILIATEPVPEPGTGALDVGNFHDLPG